MMPPVDILHHNITTTTLSQVSQAAASHDVTVTTPTTKQRRRNRPISSSTTSTSPTIDHYPNESPMTTKSTMIIATTILATTTTTSTSTMTHQEQEHQSRIQLQQQQQQQQLYLSSAFPVIVLSKMTIMMFLLVLLLLMNPSSAFSLSSLTPASTTPFSTIIGSSSRSSSRSSCIVEKRTLSSHCPLYSTTEQSSSFSSTSNPNSQNNSNKSKSSSNSNSYNFKSLEQQIVTLGRRGQTDAALQLYYDCPAPTVRIWNAAIDACARARPTRLSLAMQLFRDPQQQQQEQHRLLKPNVFTFGALMNACQRARNADQALQLLKEMPTNKYNVEPNAVVYASAISACARAISAMDDDNDDYDSWSSSSKYKYNNNHNHKSLNNKSNKNNNNKNNYYKDQALSLLQQAVEVKRVGMSVVGFNAAIAACAQAGDYHNALSILQRMQQAQPSQSQSGSSSNATSTTTFLVPPPDAVTYGTVLAACEKAQQWQLVLEQAQHMQQNSNNIPTTLDGLSLMTCLHACAELGKASESLYYLDQWKQLQQQQQEQQESSSLSSSSRQQQQQYRRRDRLGRLPLQGPDAVAYHVAISACARGGAWQDGIRLLEECKELFGNNNNDESSGANVVAYTAAITGCEYAGQWTQSFLLLDKMRKDGVEPNEITMGAVLGACATACANYYQDNNQNNMDDNDDDGEDSPTLPLPYTKGMQLLQVLKKDPTVVKPNIQIYNAAIRLCAEARQVDQAFRLLQEIKEEAKLDRTLITYGSLMTACERVGNVEYASKAFRQLKEEPEEANLVANEIIYGAAISCCRKAKEPQRALFLLQKMIKDGLSPNAACWNTVLIAQTEAKRLKDSDTVLRVYQWMRSKKLTPQSHYHQPNRQTYSILIQYFAATEQPATAEAFLDKMYDDAQLKPDVDLFTATVAAYERTNQPLKALKLMQRMEEYGYDFYSVKVLNAAFKKAVKLVNFAVDQTFVKGGSSGGDYADDVTWARQKLNATISQEHENGDDDDHDADLDSEM